MVKLMVRVKAGACALPIGPARGIRRVDEEYGSLAPGVLPHYFNPVPGHERKAVPDPADRHDSTRKGLGIPTRLQALSVLAVLDEACSRGHDALNERNSICYLCHLPAQFSPSFSVTGLLPAPDDATSLGPTLPL